MDEPIVRLDASFGAIETPRFHPEGKQKCVGIHMVSFRGGSLANQAWQKRPFPLTETAKSYNNQGGWAKSSTIIEVIEPFLFAEGIDQARRVDIAIGFFTRGSEENPFFRKPVESFWNGKRE